MALVARDAPGAKRLTRLNEELLGHRALGRVEEMRWKSSKDGRDIQGWIVTPPGFDATQKYPLILEIHGGPFANYGAALRLRDAALRGRRLRRALHQPARQHQLRRGVRQPDPPRLPGPRLRRPDVGRRRRDRAGVTSTSGNLFVTGGSGGGVLTAWIVGKTDRFRAAVAAKPVINWYSFVLTADATSFFYKYWFPGFPWEHRGALHEALAALAGRQRQDADDADDRRGRTTARRSRSRSSTTRR